MKIIESIRDVTEYRYGNKADNVILMYNHNILVPKSWVISHDYIMNQIREHLNLSFEQNQVSSYKEIASFLNNYPSELYIELYDAVSRLVNDQKKVKRFVVRSSHLFEDGNQFSYSGLFTTELNLATPVNIVDAILKCWAECFNDGIVEYYNASNHSGALIPCAILIQEFIPSEVSGVIFKSGDTIEINSTWGMAKSIVDGSTGYDSWHYDKDGYQYTNSKNIITLPVFTPSNPRKGEYIPFFLSNEIVEVVNFDNRHTYVQAKLSHELANRETLNAPQISELKRKCTMVAAKLGIINYDIEWAIHENELYILQCRSLTRMLKSKTSRSRYQYLPLVDGVAQGKCFYVSSENDAKNFPHGALLAAKNLSGSVLLAAMKASGCVLESKSPLSHSAIIARELGIPAIGAVDMQEIEFGEYYVLDGGNGILTRGQEDGQQDSNLDRCEYDLDNLNLRKLQTFLKRFVENM